jgi:SAM-dependent methyltransferase
MHEINYIHSDIVHNMQAARAVVPIIMDLCRPKSVLDVGCGTGTWLKAFVEKGVTDYFGIDGSDIALTKLNISSDKFLKKDLSLPFDLTRKFDLALCLEVAEHLPEAAADALVASLVAHADTIVFSAAIPGQGGQRHLNEQWPEYWEEKFSRHGYYFHDVIREKIWNNEGIEWWYKQNMFVVNKTARAKHEMISVVHPEVFRTIHSNHEEMLKSLVQGKQGMKIATKIFFRSVLFKLGRLFGR